MEKSLKNDILKKMKESSGIALALLLLGLFCLFYELNTWVLQSLSHPIVWNMTPQEYKVSYPIPQKWEKSGKLHEVYYSSCLSGAQKYAEHKKVSINLSKIKEVCQKHVQKYNRYHFQDSLAASCYFGFKWGVSIIEPEAFNSAQTESLLAEECFP